MADPKGFKNKVGNVYFPQSDQRKGLNANPDYIQAGMLSSGTLMLTETQLS